MRHTLLLTGLVVATAALAGCLGYGGAGYQAPPNYYGGGEWAWMGAWAGAWAAVMMMVLMLVVIAAIVVVALTFVAVLARGPAAQVAGAFLLVIGAWFTLMAMSAFSLGGMLIGLALVAVGIAALVPPQTAREGRASVVIEDRR